MPPHLHFSENWQFNVVTQWIFLRISRFLDKALVQFSWTVHIYLVPLLLPCFLLLCWLWGHKSAPYKSYLKLNMRYNMKISLLHHPPRLYRPVLPPVTTVSSLERDINRIFKRKALQNIKLWPDSLKRCSAYRHLWHLTRGTCSILPSSYQTKKKQRKAVLLCLITDLLLQSLQVSHSQHLWRWCCTLHDSTLHPNTPRAQSWAIQTLL